MPYFWALLSPTSIGGTRTRLPVHTKVIQALIRTCGMVVNVQTIVKNICHKATKIIKGIVSFSALHKYLVILCAIVTN